MLDRNNSIERLLPGIRLWAEEKLFCFNSERGAAITREDRIIGVQGLGHMLVENEKTCSGRMSWIDSSRVR